MTSEKVRLNALRAAWSYAGLGHSPGSVDFTLLEEIDAGIAMERIEFAKFIEGSDIDQEEIELRTIGNWYIQAEDALRRGLIAGLI